MKMPVINITVSPSVHRLLIKMAAETGKSLSGLGAECIEIGMDRKIEAINKRAVFLSMEEKRQTQKASESDE